MGGFSFLKPITKPISSALNSFSDVASDAWNNVSDVASDAWNNVSDVASDAWNDIAKPVIKTPQYVWNAAQNGWEDVNRIGKFIPKVYNWGESQMSSALNTVKPIVSKAWDTAEPVIQRYGAVALPVAGTMIGGPLGFAAGTALAANAPYVREGWAKNVRDVGNTIGVREIRDNPRTVGNTLAALGAGYGGANYLAGGSPTSFQWGASPLMSNTHYLAAGAEPQMYSIPLSSNGIGAGAIGNPALGAGVGQVSPLTAAATQPLTASGTTVGALANGGVYGSNSIAPVAKEVGANTFLGGLNLKDTLGAGALGLGAAGLLGGLLSPKMPEPSTYQTPDAGYLPAVDTSALTANADIMNRYAEQMAQIAAGQNAAWRQNGLPVQTKMANEALVGIDPNWWAERAQSETQAAYDSAVQQVRRNAERMGISPDSPAYANAIAQMLGPAMAAAKAGAANQARQAVEQENWNRLASTNAQLSGLPSQAASIYGSAGNMLSNSNQAAYQAAQLANQVNQYNAGLANQASMANWQAQNNYNQLMAQQQNDFWGNLMGLGGQLAMAFML